jgi:hypothetical protein
MSRAAHDAGSCALRFISCGQLSVVVCLVACSGNSHAKGVASHPTGTGGASSTSSGMSAGGNGSGGTSSVHDGTAGHAGSGGSGAGSGGAGAGTGGTGADAGPAPASSMSTAEACITYERAVAMRKAECNQSTPDPVGAGVYLCPDLLFSDGSTRTVAGLLACIGDWRAFPCDKIIAGYVPDCVTPGTRMVGQTCALSAQCESLYCIALQGQNGCGVCAPTAAEGGACNTMMADYCKPGLSCTSGKCVAPDLSMVSVTPPAPRKQTGEPCKVFDDCIEADYCDGTPGMEVCTPFPKAGEPCTPAGSYCAPDAFCEATTNKCMALPTAGQPCGLLRGDPYFCDPKLYCDKRGPGTASCVSLVDIGATCGADGTACYPGSECKSGTCKPIDSQGLFASECKM